MDAAVLETARVDVRSYGGEVRRHRHPWHQCVLPDIGRLELDTPAGGRRVAAGRGVLIPAGEDHAFHAPDANRFVIVDFPAEVACRAVDRAAGEPAFAMPPALAETVTLFLCHRANAALDERARRVWAEVLLDTLDDPVAASTDEWRFAAATTYIRRHLCRRLDRVTVAAAVEVAPDALARLFRRRAGCGVAAWITGARLELAAARLASTDASITTIALDCGFSEHSALTRAFRRRFGLTPSAWRRARRVK